MGQETWVMDTDPVAPDTEEPADDEHSSSWMVAGVLAVGLVGALIGGLFAWAVFMGDDTSTAETHTFLVEAGTGSRLDQGAQIDLMPTEVRLAVGDTLEIRNEDDRDYMVGPYMVRAGETLRQTFHRAQILVGDCSLSGSGQIQIIVL